MLASIFKGVRVFAKWEIVVRYAPNRCVAFAAFPVFYRLDNKRALGLHHQ